MSRPRRIDPAAGGLLGLGRRAARSRFGLSTALGAVVVAVLAGCTAGAAPEPDASVDRAPTSAVDETGGAPIVFAFVCDGGPGGDRSSGSATYTTYAAVWADERTHCRAERVTGTTASSQQRAAVEAAAGNASLEDLAATCAVSGTAPWTTPIGSAAEAAAAAGLALYCPGHPEMEHLREAIAAYRG